MLLASYLICIYLLLFSNRWEEVVIDCFDIVVSWILWHVLCTVLALTYFKKKIAPVFFGGFFFKILRLPLIHCFSHLFDNLYFWRLLFALPQFLASRCQILMVSKFSHLPMLDTQICWGLIGVRKFTWFALCILNYMINFCWDLSLYIWLVKIYHPIKYLPNI